jgi:hypothetical protein
MNILPLILAFLLIFSALSVGFIRGRKESCVAEKCAARFFQTSRCALNRVAERGYRKVKVDAPPKTVTTEKKGAKRPPPAIVRTSTPPLETSKLNLTPLLDLETDPKRHPLYEIAAQLLRLLYDESLLKEDREYALLDAFCAQEKVETLMDLYPKEAGLQPLFYKMFKGTHTYRLDKRQGIPPFGDFFTLGKQSAIHFSFASPILLEALFGKTLRAKILAEEKKKAQKEATSCLTQEELTALLTGDSACSALVMELGTQLNFSLKREKRKEIIAQDKQTDLIVSKPL